ncbi:DUF4011 domain-containing protein [Actinomyces bowdenii]|uniref:DUF4011 domain-containing protein n=1 Tax=Actinomyces bowdenii TaxID=131109 RepID=UPI001FBAB58F|nr:DUF4011 domain-containing protein [Actinomyces bowdenii]
MELDNRDIVLKALLGVLPRCLEPYLRARIEDSGPQARDLADLADLSVQIDLLTRRGGDGRHLFHLPAGLAGKLHEVRRFRNEADHGEAFDDGKALAALVAVGEVLRLIGSPQGREEVHELIRALGLPGPADAPRAGKAPAPRQYRPGPAARGRGAPPAPSAPQAEAAGAPTGGAAGRAVPPRIEWWKRSLLDLTLRNPLINRLSHSTDAPIELEVPQDLVGRLEDLVNDRELIVLRPAHYNPGPGAQEEGRAARLLAEHRQVETSLARKDYTATLQALAARAQTIVDDTGANNLYLAIGTLEWSLGGRQVRSPLILIPVTLHRTGQEGDEYGIALDETGVSTPNHSFLTSFAQETGIELAELAQPLHDEHGLDLESTLDRVRRRLRQEGRHDAVSSTVHLGLFQFSTYRMWRDLDEHWPTIAANPLVGHLVQAPPSPFADPAGAAPEADIDAVIEALPLTADATQARVVAEAVAGRSFVVEGPPGTGKSQTVANLIFRALATGRTVMFVAEKRSALDVVARRLSREAGIGGLVLNLHDNRMRPSAVRQALREALDLRPGQVPGSLSADRRAIAAIREHLEAYRAGVHGPNCVGHSYYEARAELVLPGQAGAGIPPESEQWWAGGLPQGRDALASFLQGAGLEEAAADLLAPGPGGTGGLRRQGAAPDLRVLDAATRRRVAQASFVERSRRAGLEAFDAAAHARLLGSYRQVQERLRGALAAELLSVVARKREEALAGAGQRAQGLREEIHRRRRGMSVREIMDSYGDLVTALTPCILVSPDSVARFFPADRQFVDIVVFDEASQIPVANAVGTMGRGRSVVVVGDPKQMPPTAVASAAARDAGEGGPREEDSILTQCLAGGVRRHRLTWHYRSTVESLIAFSNEHYYDGALHSFPSPLGMEAGPDDSPGGHGISMRRVKGHYIRAEERYKYPRARPGTNPQEAREIVMEVIRRFEASPERAPSLGVVTFNLEQRDLIEQRLRAEGPPRVVEALDDPDGLLLKNLENVQGEERDTILFSVTYSANSRGELPLTFGPLSRAGGERRLNVAITRARRQIIVFASFDPEDLRAERSAHQGIKDLRAYLEMARDGGAPPSFFSAPSPARSQVDWHRQEIAEELRGAGLEVKTGVGQSSFTIDLVLSGPGRPDHPRVAVLLDGPQWSGRMSVTDRDLLPVDVLERMGWPRVERIWAPEWVRDRQAVIDRMVDAVGGKPPAPPAPAAAGACGGKKGSAAPGGPAPAGASSAPTPPGAPGAAPAAGTTVTAGAVTGAAAPAGASGGSSGAGAAAGPPGPTAPEAPTAASEGGQAPRATRAPEYTPWRRTQVLPRETLDRAVAGARPDPEARAEVVRVARQICAVESPLAFHRLAVHLCRAFGLTRTVASREQGLRRALGSAFAYIDQEDFVWVSMASAGEPVRYRRNALDHVEGIEQIHPRELVSLLSEIRSASPAWISKEDLFRKALDRLSSKRRRLTERVWAAMDAALETAERDAAPGP